ncbi:MAG: hypothetical protein ABIO92_01205 [Chloroflexia bacterium]
MPTKTDYMKAVDSKLAGWDGEIEHLDARVDIILLQLEDKYYQLLRTLRAKEKAIRGNLEQLNASEDEWESIKSCVDQASSDMEHTLRIAASELQ